MVPLKADFSYAILDDRGMADAAASALEGIYRHDTRHLSRYQWIFEDTGLIHQQVFGDRIVQFFSRMKAHAQVLLIRRTLQLEPAGFLDSLDIENSSDEEVALTLGLDVDGDFVDIFEARGYRRQMPAEPVARRQGAGDLVMTYRARDGITSATRLHYGGFMPGRPLRIPARERLRLTVTGKLESELPAAKAAPETPAQWCPVAPASPLGVHERDAFDQAVADIGSLLLNTGQGRTIAAGIPNFVVPFGRDSLVTAWLLLDADSTLARSVLAYLAAHQGRKVDDFRDEEPGKIMHEHRECELSRIGELPFRTYYGSADSTPLFLMLLGDYVERTGDVAFARALEPNWRAALGWIEQYSDDRGLINFRRRGDGKGLTVQSWKDSHDSMSYGDGRLAGGELAVAEVQGYVHAAYRAAADLSRACGGPAEEQHAWTERAEALAAAFERQFWMPGHDNYALGLDGRGRQLDVNASDSGHLLWTGIVAADKAPRLIARLFADDLWSGYGLRTLSSREKRYNPLSYHNGSVWPHDTALFAAGLRRYGDMEGFARVREALLALATASHDKRLPELVGGYPRRGDTPPLPYVESCRPQAWAAAALIYVLTAR